MKLASIVVLGGAFLLTAGCDEASDPYEPFYGKTLQATSVTAGSSVIGTTDQEINGMQMHIESPGLKFVATEEGAIVRDNGSINDVVARMDGEISIFEDSIPLVLTVAIDVRETGTVGTEGWSGFAGSIGGTAISGQVEPRSGQLLFHRFDAAGQNGIGIGPSAKLRLDTLTVAP